jgi:hypothetical protein
VPPDPQQELALAPIVEVRPAVGERWVGIFFADGAANVRGTIIGWPDQESLCFVGGGGAYLVRSTDPQQVKLLGDSRVQQYYVAQEAETILFADWSELEAFDASGRRWRSPRLCLDDLEIVGVDGELISCTGFFGDTSGPFTVDLRTGRSDDSPMVFDY